MAHFARGSRKTIWVLLLNSRGMFGYSGVALYAFATVFRAAQGRMVRRVGDAKGVAGCRLGRKFFQVGEAREQGLGRIGIGFGFLQVFHQGAFTVTLHFGLVAVLAQHFGIVAITRQVVDKHPRFHKQGREDQEQQKPRFANLHEAKV